LPEPPRHPGAIPSSSRLPPDIDSLAGNIGSARGGPGCEPPSLPWTRLVSRPPALRAPFLNATKRPPPADGLPGPRFRVRHIATGSGWRSGRRPNPAWVIADNLGPTKNSPEPAHRFPRPLRLRSGPGPAPGRSRLRKARLPDGRAGRGCPPRRRLTFGLFPGGQWLFSAIAELGRLPTPPLTGDNRCRRGNTPVRPAGNSAGGAPASFLPGAHCPEFFLFYWLRIGEAVPDRSQTHGRRSPAARERWRPPAAARPNPEQRSALATTGPG